MPPPHIVLTGDPLDITELMSPPGETSGASAHFLGHVRGSADLTALELLHHPALTQDALYRIGRSAMDRFALDSLTIAHRFGKMQVGETIVFIAAHAPHRRSAIDAMTSAIDVLKTQAPFWKREWRGTSYDWIEPTEADHAAAGRWMKEDA